MKTLGIFVLFFYNFCNSQIINIPDSNFKNRLLMASPSNGFAGVGPDINNATAGAIDTNGNGEIEVSEAQTVAILQLGYCNISNLEGIQYFTNLGWLSCEGNNLTQLSISQLTKLIRLYYPNNQITAIDLSSQTQLKQLACSNNAITTLNLTNQLNLEILIAENNQLSSLNFSNNPALQRVYCGGNLLTSLDFSSNPAFIDLGCRNNPNLTSIKIRNGATQLFGAGTYYNQCWTNVPNLNYICADSAEIPVLQTFLSGCGVNQAITIDSACPLGVAGFTKEAFAIVPNPSSDGLFNIVFNDIIDNGTIEVYNMLGQLIKEEKIKNTNDYKLNIPIVAGTYILRFNNGSEQTTKRLIIK